MHCNMAQRLLRYGLRILFFTEATVPRYLVERTFPEGVGIPATEAGARLLGIIVANNGESGVTWLHSYVATDKRRTFCVYDAPSPEAIRAVGRKNGLPVGEIHEVRVLDPYFHH